MLTGTNVILTFCGRLNFINWLQNHLIPCPFKYLTGIDCPGCGFQRAIIAVIQGDLDRSFTLYPAAIPLMLFFIYGIADKLFALDTSKQVIKKTGFILLGSMILVSYGIKMWNIFQHYNTSACATMWP